MTDKIKRLVADYHATAYMYQKMLDYYNGKHDILNTYRYEENRANNKTVINYIQKFVEEELSYTLGNPISYISKSGNENIVNDIDYSLYHWQTTHNQELCRQLEIFGIAYELYYINHSGEFCSRILNPTNSICYTDTDNIPQIFIHFYKLKYDDSEYYDVYYRDKIEIYKDNTLQSTKKHIFSGVPVSICSIGAEQTIYNKIKGLNDAYNLIASDQINIISDYRNAYLTVTGATVDEETADMLKIKGILNIPGGDAKVSWLIKNIDSSYIDSMLKEIKNSMYSVCNHVDSQERLQSNISGTALRSRLVFLEQRCKTVFDAVCDTVYDRLQFLFEYLVLKNKVYEWRDIVINFNPNIPQDIEMMSRVITNVGDKISQETAISLLGIAENPANEIAKIKKERAELEKIDLNKIHAV
ncbi:MAG: phage portal protein [Clostridium sp.]|uniref:phage portal protein n=1 Tax=Clostridium sp. TaxID=1506 RepID=UPI0029091AF7|nr:phage portal protein [Clostridium sp.]MDU7337938.1 phage portal protein [Clostridium sp.]